MFAVVACALSIPAAARADRFFQGAARDAAFAEVAQLREIQGRHLAEIMAAPGVNGTGIGLDRQTGRLLFDVMVDVGAPDPALPAAIEGVPVRLVHQQRMQLQNTCNTTGTACHADLQTLPVEMGNSAFTGPVAVAGGTRCYECSLGFKACDLWTVERAYVTASHCSKGAASICSGSATTGDPTYHRAPGDAVPTCALENVIGAVAQQRPPSCPGVNMLDAASVTSADSLTQASIRDIGMPSAYAGAPMPGDGVQKSGRTSGYTLGTITDVAAAVTITSAEVCNCPGGTVTFTDQLRIERAWNGAGFPNPAAVLWSRQGDSGAAVLEDTGTPPAIVGLDFLGDPTNTIGYSNPISEVLAQLDLSLDPLDCSSPCAAILTAHGTSDPRRALRDTRAFRDAVLTRSPLGLLYIDRYYAFTGQVVTLLSVRPALLAQTAQVYQSVVPVLEAVAAAPPGRLTPVAPESIQAVDAIAAQLRTATVDPLLRDALDQLRHDLFDPTALAELGMVVR
jgi:hypothetical protein